MLCHFSLLFILINIQLTTCAFGLLQIFFLDSKESEKKSDDEQSDDDDEGGEEEEEKEDKKVKVLFILQIEFFLSWVYAVGERGAEDGNCPRGFSNAIN